MSWLYQILEYPFLPLMSMMWEVNTPAVEVTPIRKVFEEPLVFCLAATDSGFEGPFSDQNQMVPNTTVDPHGNSTLVRGLHFTHQVHL